MVEASSSAIDPPQNFCTIAYNFEGAKLQMNQSFVYRWNPDEECVAVAVLGEQQKGKSTFMNKAFSTYFKSNNSQILERTTNGVDHQHVKFDGITLHCFDAEGIFSNEIINKIKTKLIEESKNSENQISLQEAQKIADDRNKTGCLRVMKFLTKMCNAIFVIMKQGDHLNHVFDNFKLFDDSEQGKLLAEQFFQKAYFIFRASELDQQESCKVALADTLPQQYADYAIRKTMFIHNIPELGQKYMRILQDEKEEYDKSVKNLGLDRILRGLRKNTTNQLFKNSLKQNIKLANNYEDGRELLNDKSIRDEINRIWAMFEKKPILRQSILNRSLRLLKTHYELSDRENQLDIFLQDDANLEAIKQASVLTHKDNQCITRNSSYAGIIGIAFDISADAIPPLAFVSLGISALQIAGKLYATKTQEIRIDDKVSQDQIANLQKSIDEYAKMINNSTVDKFLLLKACYLCMPKNAAQITISTLNEIQKERIKSTFIDLLLEENYRENQNMLLQFLSNQRSSEGAIGAREVGGLFASAVTLQGFLMESERMIVRFYGASGGGTYSFVNPQLMRAGEFANFEQAGRAFQTVEKAAAHLRQGLAAEQSIVIAGKRAEELQKIGATSKFLKAAGPLLSALSLAMEIKNLILISKTSEEDAQNGVVERFEKMKSFHNTLKELLSQVENKLKEEVD